MSAPDWRRNAQLVSRIEKSASTIGIYVTDQGGRAVVQVGPSRIQVRYGVRFRPRPGDGVVLTFQGNTVRLTGPTAAHSKLGKITAVDVGAGIVSVSCDGKTYTRMPYTVAYQQQSNPDTSSGPKVGHTVSIDWDGYYVIGQVTQEPDEPAVPPLTSGQKPFTVTIYPTQSGSFTTATNRWNGTRGDLYCDSKHDAAWFYGDTVRNTLRDDGLILSLEVYLSLRTKKGAQPSIGRHNDPSEQKDGVSASDAAPRGWKGWIPLPSAWANAWRTDVGGLTISGGDSVYRGIGADHQSGKLRIRGRQ